MVRLLKRRNNIGLPMGDRQALSNQPISDARSIRNWLRSHSRLASVRGDEPNDYFDFVTPQLSYHQPVAAVEKARENWVRFAILPFFEWPCPPVAALGERRNGALAVVPIRRVGLPHDLLVVAMPRPQSHPHAPPSIQRQITILSSRGYHIATPMQQSSLNREPIPPRATRAAAPSFSLVGQALRLPSCKVERASRPSAVACVERASRLLSSRSRPIHNASPFTRNTLRAGFTGCVWQVTTL